MNYARQLSGLRTQYRAMFRHMAIVGGQWNIHRGSAGLVLLSEQAEMSVPLPVLVHDVQAKSEEGMVNAVWAALQRETYSPVPAKLNIMHIVEDGGSV